LLWAKYPRETIAQWTFGSVAPSATTIDARQENLNFYCGKSQVNCVQEIILDFSTYKIKLLDLVYSRLWCFPV
jgi:hypothetical protein